MSSRGLPHPEAVWSRMDARQQELANQETVVNFSANRTIVQPANQNMTISSAFARKEQPENHSIKSHHNVTTETV